MTTDKLSTKLWNIATDAAIKSINGELSDYEFQKATEKFQRTLEKALANKQLKK